MDYNNNADKYADECLAKNMNFFREIVKQAFLDGFNAKPQVIANYDGDYVDLGLPSGTLWARKYVGAIKNNFLAGVMPYSKAKEYDLPTKEDFLELGKLKKDFCSNIVRFYGLNGEILELPIQYHYNGSRFPVVQGHNYVNFWMKDCAVSNAFEVESFCLGTRFSGVEFKKEFAGAHLPVLTVKRKKI